jgi:hypothetical protein
MDFWARGEAAGPIGLAGLELHVTITIFNIAMIYIILEKSSEYGG